MAVDFSSAGFADGNDSRRGRDNSPQQLPGFEPTESQAPYLGLFVRYHFFF